MKEIELTKGHTAIVDDEDFEIVNQYSWHYHNNGYARSTIKCGDKRKNLYLHRMVLNVFDSNIQIDHKNGNGLDNRKENLRIATNKQNSRNRKPNHKGSSKFKGIRYRSHKKTNNWEAQIVVDNKQLFIGSFSTEIIAAKAYDTRAKELFGEFAYLNFKE